MVFRWVTLGTLTMVLMLAAILAGSAVVAAAPSSQGEEQQGVFGNVVELTGSEWHIRTKNGDLTIQVTANTQFRSAGPGEAGLQAVHPGDRVAATVFQVDGVPVARLLMVVPKKGNLRHINGVVSEVTDGVAYIVAPDGARRPVEFGLKHAVPAPGTVVTIAGHLDSETGVVRAQSTQLLEQTLKRLSNQLDEIQETVHDRKSKVQYLARAQRMLEKTSERHLEILNEAVEHLPDEARPALERALRNLDDANGAVLRAFNQALELAAEQEVEDAAPDVPQHHELLRSVEPSLEDVVQVLGITEDKLTEKLAQGMTLAQVAQDLGFTQNDFVDGVLTLVRPRVEALAEARGLDPAQVDQVIDKMRQEADKHIHRAFTAEEAAHPEVPASADDLARIMRVEVTELFARLRQGENLMEIAREHGVSRQQLIREIMTLAERRAKHLVDEGVMRPDDVERFLRQSGKEIEAKLVDGPGPIKGPQDGHPITPEDVASLLGVSVRELMAHFEQGGTFQQLARRHQMTADELAAKLLDIARERLSSRVERGEITSADVARMLASLREEFFQQADNNTPPVIGAPEPVPTDLIRAPFDLGAVAMALGLSPQRLHELLAQGTSIPELAEESNVSLEDLASLLVQPMEEKLRHMIETEQIDSQRVREMLGRMRQGMLASLRDFRLRRLGEAPPAVRDVRPQPSWRPYPDMPLTIEEVAGILDSSPEELMERLDGPQNIRELLKGRRLTVDQFVDELVKVTARKLRAQVAQGATPEQKVEPMLKELRRRLLTDLGEHEQPRPVPDNERPVVGPPANLARLAQVLDLPIEELHDLLSRGYTVAEVARNLEVPLERLVNALIAPANARVDALVDKGQIDRHIAREALEEARGQVERDLKETRHALDEQRQDAWEELDAEQEARRHALQEELEAAWKALEAERVAAWSALDSEHQSYWQATEQEQQAAWRELDERLQAQRDQLDARFPTAWQQLQADQKSAWRALDAELEAARQALEEGQQAARASLAGQQDQQQRGTELELQPAAWQELGQYQQGLRQTLDREHQAAREALEQEQQLAWQALEDEAGLARQELENRFKAVWEQQDQKHEEAWRLLEVRFRAASVALEEAQQARWQALEQDLRAAWEELDAEQQKEQGRRLGAPASREMGG